MFVYDVYDDVYDDDQFSLILCLARIILHP